MLLKTGRRAPHARHSQNISSRSSSKQSKQRPPPPKHTHTHNTHQQVEQLRDLAPQRRKAPAVGVAAADAPPRGRRAVRRGAALAQALELRGWRRALDDKERHDAVAQPLDRLWLVSFCFEEEGGQRLRQRSGADVPTSSAAAAAASRTRPHILAAHTHSLSPHPVKDDLEAARVVRRERLRELRLRLRLHEPH